MRRPLLVLTLVFVAVFAATYALSSSVTPPPTVAHDAGMASAASAATPWWHHGPGIDCAGGTSDVGSCGDFGGGGAF